MPGPPRGRAAPSGSMSASAPPSSRCRHSGRRLAQALYERLLQRDHVRTGMGLGCRWYGLGQEGRRYVPLAAIIGNDRDGLPVVTRQHTLDRTTSLGLEDHPVPDLELEHLGVRPHLLKEAQTLDNSMIEVDEFCFGQFINVDRHNFT